MKSPRERVVVGLTLIALCLALVVGICAQVNTKTSTATGKPKTEAVVERGEVVRIDGNDLLVRMEDGTLRHFNHLPESATVLVEGKKLGIHELQPGMKLERTITTTTTPETVTTVQTVTGTVFSIAAPNSVILRLEDGTNQKFNIPKGQKFTVNGEQTDAWGLKKGMKISATKVVEEPQTVVDHQKEVTGTMPPPPPSPPADHPILVAVSKAPAQIPTPAQPPEPVLPKTGSSLPLIGLFGALLFVVGLGLRAARLLWGG